MKLKYIGQFNTIKDYVADKIQRASLLDKTFAQLFEMMFEDGENIFCETTEGYRIKKMTYLQCKEQTITLAKKLKTALGDVASGATIGLSMENSPQFIQCFWAILMCGCNPLLVNLRLPQNLLERTFADANIQAVISTEQTSFHNTITLAQIDAQEQSQLGEWGTQVIFTSSGTSDSVKLCYYTAQNFFYQISTSFDIIKTCPQVIKHYDGEIKLLALLPLYHVFGFIAVYLWFAFFGRTLVFLKDLAPQTLLSTVKKHKVTHLFAVPMVFEKIHKQAIKTIKARGEKTYKKFNKALALCNKSKLLGTLISNVAFKEIRDNIFGDSIRMFITGGSAISKETVQFLNAIGYYTVNGYGMTEIGITSVETSTNPLVRNLCSIGNPFGVASYKVQDGQLYVKSQARASKIVQNGVVDVANLDEWFNTGDCAYQSKGRFYITGRSDDLIISSAGENINPQAVEDCIKVDGVLQKCLIRGEKGAILLLSVKAFLSNEHLKGIHSQTVEILKTQGLLSEIEQIVITQMPLMEENEFKVSRERIKKRLQSGQIAPCKMDKTLDEQASQLEQELIAILAEVLGTDVAIAPNSDLFVDLNASSLDYFTFTYKVKDRFELTDDFFHGKPLTTIKEFANILLDSFK